MLFIVGNFITRSSCKRNCLTKFTVGIFAIQSILSCIVNVSNLGCLCISMVCYCNFNVLIAKVNDFAFCSLNISCVTSKHWTSNVIQCLTVSGRPSDLLSYQILGTVFSKVDCLLAITWCHGIIIHDIVNSHINIIVTTYLLSTMLQVNIEDIVVIVCSIRLIIKAVRY